jgi:formyltetrahydrofolate-dependent phosphoribosylglycinamide formyltransferase
VTTRLAVLASGSGTNLQAIIDASQQARLDAEVVLVVTDRSEAGARERARRAGIAEVHLPIGPHRADGGDPATARRTYDAALADEVAAAAPDWIVLAGWMRLLSSAFLDRFPGRVVNLHPALPGQFPGPHAIDEAWAAHTSTGLDHTGVMVHLVPDERVDEGPVLASRVVPFAPGETRESLEVRIHEVEHELLVAVLADLSAGVV